MTRRADPRETRLPVPAGELPAFTPVPRQTKRHDGWTDDRQRRFIEALADTGSVEAACRAVNMSTVGAYHLRRQKGAESFRKAWAAALDLGVQRIEDVSPFLCAWRTGRSNWGPRAQRRGGAGVFLWQAPRHPHRL